MSDSRQTFPERDPWYEYAQAVRHIVKIAEKKNTDTVFVIFQTLKEIRKRSQAGRNET